ncbi:UDP-N-acetylmuramoyl-L-alanyl-D-glutamate--2,6-diaminopimelate ligase [Treponema endosymbiont of Eucomonympha sp.]|uniref:UDP-N-acetylmuramoyl-L-alanyl-D-glutamate--2, 6-diaminopimelate ligase n=1 Tax=Treponema endosymbiont of Eucomonympha sp. TaxID=1580831 RepID=UPI000A6D1A9D|nr:UDP-N-acetylmuramoyl-L-alanyl-D-glutamate--2,6-diaminopimelate ligase [Treponema endosymbiont of Eucomonympha sp.]
MGIEAHIPGLTERRKGFAFLSVDFPAGSALHCCIMQLRFSRLLSGIPCRLALNGESDPLIAGIAYDSRNAAPRSLFFALPGIHANGADYIPQALEAGARAVIYQGELPVAALEAARRRDAALAQVADARFALSPVSAAFYGRPSERLAVVGVTGTEGKSSTVSFIWQLLRLAGKKAGFISTVAYSLGGEVQANPRHETTPEAPVVQQRLYEMAENGCEYAVLEASSHGLSLRTNRLGDVRFDAAVMTNVAREHLEFHGTWEHYRDDKANLFRVLDGHPHEKRIGGTQRTVPAFGVVNADDLSAAFFAAATRHNTYGFSASGSVDGRFAACFAAQGISAGKTGVSFSVSADENTAPRLSFCVEAPLPGAFNAANVLAALVTVSRLCGISVETLAPLAAQLVPVRGRMTAICRGQPFEVLVDYAHTPSSFEAIFPPLRARAKGKIISLFGSGGERDTEKRPEQGRIAGRYSDIVVLADEDPRGEDPRALLEAIETGCLEAGKMRGRDVFVIPDRPRAIRQAFAFAESGDIVLLLGKAHENSIIYKDFAMPYDEIAEAEQALAEKGYTA